VIINFSNDFVSKVKHHMQSRLSELEPMPELLKSAEVKVQQLTDQLEHYAKLNAENGRLIAELTAKVHFKLRVFCNSKTAIRC